jgi:hypothetical protein
METSKRRHTPKRVRDGESRTAKIALKIPPELPAEPGYWRAEKLVEQLRTKPGRELQPVTPSTMVLAID